MLTHYFLISNLLNLICKRVEFVRCERFTPWFHVFAGNMKSAVIWDRERWLGNTVLNKFVPNQRAISFYPVIQIASKYATTIWIKSPRLTDRNYLKDTNNAGSLLPTNLLNHRIRNWNRLKFERPPNRILALYIIQIVTICQRRPLNLYSSS